MGQRPQDAPRFEAKRDSWALVRASVRASASSAGWLDGCKAHLVSRLSPEHLNLGEDAANMCGGGGRAPEGPVSWLRSQAYSMYFRDSPSDQKGRALMDIGKNFIGHGRIDHAKIKDLVLNQTEEAWNTDPYRQIRYKEHKDTHTIPILYDKDRRHFDPTRKEKYLEFEMVLTPVFEKLAQLFNHEGCIVRCMFARLKSGGMIPPHCDKGYSLNHSHRVHIPIATNNQAVLTVGDEDKVLREGEVWEINNSRVHAAKNGGAEPRIHLICDWAPPILDEGEKEAYRLERIKISEQISKGEPIDFS